jgi:predicted GH43/DUF377 family glycosyl hydrolase
MKNLLKLWLLAIVLALDIGVVFGQYAWTKDPPNSILSGGALGAWDRQVFMPRVLYNSDSLRYEMWFGGSSFPWTTHWRPYRIGFASSRDGFNWEMDSSAVLSPDPGTWDEFTTEQFSVIRENGQYKMWYSSWTNSPPYPGYIGYATSPDGIHWTKYSGNPVLGPGTASWEAGGPTSCCVIPIAGGYKMWYAGYDASGSTSSIGSAFSPDGINWQRDNAHNPGLTGSASYPFISEPQVMQTADACYMWYLNSGNSQNICVATSNDSGRTWTKYSGNPVLVPSQGRWDGSDVEPGTVLMRGNRLDMWYTGYLDPPGQHPFKIGHATSVVTGVSEMQQGFPKRFVLAQNYPNPFNPVTNIGYSIGGVGDQGLGASNVRLVVYDILGREVAVLVNERKAPGTYEVKFDGSGLASGVYFYRLTAGTLVQTRKMMLVR